jgi:hypothetical protein
MPRKTERQLLAEDLEAAYKQLPRGAEHLKHAVGAMVGAVKVATEWEEMWTVRERFNDAVRDFLLCWRTAVMRKFPDQANFSPLGVPEWGSPGSRYARDGWS